MTRLPPEAIAAVQDWQKGGRLMLDATPPGGADACANCGGGGYVALRFVLGGPYRQPLTGQREKGKDRISAWLTPELRTITQEGWYEVDDRSYCCPVCTRTIYADGGPVRRAA